MAMNKQNVTKKFTASVIVLALLSFCLCLTTFALAYSIVVVENNIFQTGYVSIDLNGQKPIIEENEFVFEPGMTVNKGFYIKNNSTGSVYYKLYFDRVDGELAKVLEITISSNGKVLYTGTIADINEKVAAADDELAACEKRDFTITFSFPEAVGNAAKEQYLYFDLCADAVQTKNNPQRLFN